MKKVVIYPGRFQPMLPHHAAVYKKLQATFSDADVYVATSDKVEGTKSPFNFKEKAEIMQQLHDIPSDKILLAPQPYLVDSFKQFDLENTMVIFAVGEKDTERFPMKNVDEKTGLDMTVRGEPRPKYYQMINTLKQHPALPMSERGYIYVAPNIDTDGEVASASAFRKAFTSVEDEQGQKAVFEKYFGEFNNNIFNLFKNKILGDKMKEDLDILKKLAGLTEGPINFGDLNKDQPEDDEDDLVIRPGFKEMPMVDQLGKILDSDEASKDAEAMKIKKFNPVTSVKTDDGATVDITPAEAEAVKKMINMLPSNRGGEEQSPREKFLDAIQTEKGLTNMLDFARKKGLVKETNELPKLDLSDIRRDYGIEEGRMKDIVMDLQDMSKKEFCSKHPEYADDYEDLCKQYDIEMDESAPFGEPSQREEQYNTLITAYENGEEELAEVLGLSMQELDQEMTEFAMEHGLHMDDDRDEVVQGYIEQVVDNADYKDHGEYESIEENAGEYSYTLEYNGEENGYSKHILTITNPEGESKVVGDDFTYFDQEGDELQAELESWFHKGMGVADASVEDESIEESACGCCGNDPCDCPKDCKGCMEESADLEQLKKLAGI